MIFVVLLAVVLVMSGAVVVTVVVVSSQVGSSMRDGGGTGQVAPGPRAVGSLPLLSAHTSTTRTDNVSVPAAATVEDTSCPVVETEIMQQESRVTRIGREPQTADFDTGCGDQRQPMSSVASSLPVDAQSSQAEPARAVGIGDESVTDNRHDRRVPATANDDPSTDISSNHAVTHSSLTPAVATKPSPTATWARLDQLSKISLEQLPIAGSSPPRSPNPKETSARDVGSGEENDNDSPSIDVPDQPRNGVGLSAPGFVGGSTTVSTSASSISEKDFPKLKNGKGPDGKDFLVLDETDGNSRVYSLPDFCDDVVEESPGRRGDGGQNAAGAGGAAAAGGGGGGKKGGKGKGNRKRKGKGKKGGHGGGGFGPVDVTLTSVVGETSGSGPGSGTGAVGSPLFLSSVVDTGTTGIDSTPVPATVGETICPTTVIGRVPQATGIGRGERPAAPPWRVTSSLCVDPGSARIGSGKENGEKNRQESPSAQDEVLTNSSSNAVTNTTADPLTLGTTLSPCPVKTDVGGDSASSSHHELSHPPDGRCRQGMTDSEEEDCAQDLSIATPTLPAATVNNNIQPDFEFNIATNRNGDVLGIVRIADHQNGNIDTSWSTVAYEDRCMPSRRPPNSSHQCTPFLRRCGDAAVRRRGVRRRGVRRPPAC